MNRDACLLIQHAWLPARDGISMVLGRPILYVYKIWVLDQYYLLYWVFLDIISN
jgi:hypothetical protein